jgi:hypothetical protein
MNRPRLATAFILAVVLITNAEPSWAQITNVQLSLKREYGGRNLFRECRLDVTILEGKGRSGLLCSRTAGSENPGSVSRNRDLTASEVGEILKLSGASDLFNGGHVGTDSTAVDGLFETLRVTEPGRRSVVLVSSGNDTFTSGSRRDLIRLLYSLLNELQKAATQE